MDNYSLGEIVLTGFEFKDNVTYYTDSITNADISYIFNIPKSEHVRIDDEIFCANHTKDIIIGYDISLLNALFSKDLFLRLQNLCESTSKAHVYNKPDEHFNLIIYCAERDETGNIIGYFCLKFLNCFGSPLKISLTDESFLINSFLVKCRENGSDSLLDCSFCNNLPAD